MKHWRRRSRSSSARRCNLLEQRGGRQTALRIVPCGVRLGSEILEPTEFSQVADRMVIVVRVPQTDAPDVTGM